MFSPPVFLYSGLLLPSSTRPHDITCSPHPLFRSSSLRSSSLPLFPSNIHRYHITCSPPPLSSSSSSLPLFPGGGREREREREIHPHHITFYPRPLSHVFSSSSLPFFVISSSLHLFPGGGRERERFICTTSRFLLVLSLLLLLHRFRRRSAESGWVRIASSSQTLTRRYRSR